MVGEVAVFYELRRGLGGGCAQADWKATESDLNTTTAEIGGER